MTKKERLAKIRQQLHDIVEQSDMNGIVFFGGVSPDDSEAEDHDIPMFYSAAGAHILIFTLIGKMMADLATRLEKEQGAGKDGIDIKAFMLEHMVAAINSALYPGEFDPGIESKDGLPPADDAKAAEASVDEDAAEVTDRLSRAYGKDVGFLIVNKKGGNA